MTEGRDAKGGGEKTNRFQKGTRELSLELKRHFWDRKWFGCAFSGLADPGKKFRSGKDTL